MTGADESAPVILLIKGVMKQLFKFMGTWLMAGSFIIMVNTVVSGAPLPLELNGVSSIFGTHIACLIVRNPNLTAPRSFILAEGESKFGIRLIAVNTVSNSVQVENGGQLQSLHLCSTPNLPSTPVPGTAAYEELLFRSKNNSGGNSDSGISGDVATMNNTALNNPTVKDNDLNAKQDSPALVNGPDPATTLKDQSSAYWYQASADIERKRIQTVQAVLAGQSQPWPLTPLTPAGTPADLIDNDGVFGDHMPGFFQH
jgi:hypothetical protein